ncbi:MAG: hypothetical protein AAF572_19100 [Cyanobacteria bacterium P01_B01_bin.77]
MHQVLSVGQTPQLPFILSWEEVNGHPLERYFPDFSDDASDNIQMHVV